jgi:hypothetical protein
MLLINTVKEYATLRVVLWTKSFFVTDMGRSRVLSVSH